MEIEDEKNCFVSNLSYLLEREIEKIDQEIPLFEISLFLQVILFSVESFIFVLPFLFFHLKLFHGENMLMLSMIRNIGTPSLSCPTM